MVRAIPCGCPGQAARAGQPQGIARTIYEAMLTSQIKLDETLRFFAMCFVFDGKTGHAYFFAMYLMVSRVIQFLWFKMFTGITMR
jgi:hypothetical protein